MNLTWQLTVLIAVGMITLVALVWLDKKYAKKEGRRFPNVFMITIIGGVFLSLMIFVMEAIDLLPEGWHKDYWWVFPLLFLMMYAAAAVYVKRFKPPGIEKHKEAIIKRLWDDDHATLYKGSGFRSPWVRHKISETDDQNKMYNKVRSFLVLADGTHPHLYLITQDLFTLEPTEWNAGPTKKDIDKAFGKGVSASPDIQRAMEVAHLIEGNGEEENNDNDEAQEE